VVKARDRRLLIPFWLLEICLVVVMSASMALAGDQTTPPSSSILGENKAPIRGAADQADPSDGYEEDEDSGGPPLLRIADPLESWNRAMFVFNDKCYFWVMKPVATGYKKVVYEPLRIGIRNFFYNLGMPVRFVGCVLQAKAKGALGELGRFTYNTTFGFFGFGDPAAKYPALNPDAEDFGQTLGKYGIGHGIYLVWPLLGPSSIRETIGSAGDYFLSPITYVDPMAASIGLNAEDRINSLSFHLGDYETLKNAALDPYISARDAYIQYRKGRVEK
jgi:phospholipid-binding lipoprotein MlaA